MTTTSWSQYWSCVKTSEHPLPCSSIKNNHLYSLKSKQQTLCATPKEDFQLFMSTQASMQAAEKPFTPLPFASHAMQLQPQTCSWASCPGACATSCKNISTAAQDPKQLCRASAERQRYWPQAPAHSQRQPSLLHSLDTLRLPHQHLPNKWHLFKARKP